MKKLLAVLMIAGLFSFAACSGNEQPAEAVDNAAEEAMEATDDAMEAVSEAAETMTEAADSTMGAVEGAVEDVAAEGEATEQ